MISSMSQHRNINATPLVLVATIVFLYFKHTKNIYDDTFLKFFRLRCHLYLKEAFIFSGIYLFFPIGFVLFYEIQIEWCDEHFMKK